MENSFLRMLAFVCLVKFVESEHIKQGCPLVCQCEKTPTRPVVNCRSIWVTTIPDIGLNASEISIIGGNIKVLPYFAFRKTVYNSITGLTLSHNQIDILEEDCFKGLENVVSLSLNGNNIANISEKQLQSLKEVTDLMMTGNKLTTFHSFCVMKKLRFLKIDDNNLTSARFASCYRNVTSLTRIHLGRNQRITEISGEDLRNLDNSKVSELYFSGCKLAKVSKDAFDHLPYLKTLDLRSNQVKQLHPDMFLKTRYISTLFISSNKFQQSPDDAIGSLTNLEKLYIGGNNLIGKFEIGPVFRNFTKLTMLSLQRQRLVTLTNDTFEHLSNCPINELIISECSIRSVEANTFLPLSKTLQNLNIGYNPLNASELESALFSLRQASFKTYNFNGFHLKDLKNLTFRFLVKNITFLSIENSEIKYISKGVFSNFKNLTTLHLSNNHISSIDEDFSNLIQLTTLILKNNNLYTVPSAKQGQLPPNLEYLSLDGNNIHSISETAFDGLDRLKNLHLRQTEIKKISRNCWRPLISLEYLDLRDNGFGTLSSFSGELPNKLSELRLANNRISYFEDVDFSSLKNLKKFDFSNQKGLIPNISMIVKRLISPLVQLNKLNLGNLVLKNLAIDTFQNSTNLQELDLKNNRFNSWDPRLFKPLIRLRFLRLSDNSIFYINKLSFSYLYSLREIDLSNNPFYCDCNLLWFRNVFLYQANVFVGGLDDMRKYVCEAPSKLAGTPLLEFQITSKDCAHVTIRRLTVFALFSFVALTSVISAVFRYRWYIRYWVYIKTGRINQPRYARDVIYDAYVSYHSKDLKWVIQKLLPALEYNGEFKLCLEDRDWGVGEMFIDCVKESIEKSRKTILILSDNYAKCRRCQQVLALAHHRYLDDNIDVLVPILLSDIQAKNLTAGISALLTQKIYIEWPQDKNKENQFWKGVKVALKKPQRRV